jgi:hypothetical protein
MQTTPARLADECAFFGATLADSHGRAYCGCSAFIQFEQDACLHLDFLRQDGPADAPQAVIYEAYSYARSGKAVFDGYTWAFSGSKFTHGPFKTRAEAEANIAYAQQKARA